MQCTKHRPSAVLVDEAYDADEEDIGEHGEGGGELSGLSRGVQQGVDKVDGADEVVETVHGDGMRLRGCHACSKDGTGASVRRLRCVACHIVRRFSMRAYCHEFA